MAFATKVRHRMSNARNPHFITLVDKHAVKLFARTRGVQSAELYYVTEIPDSIPFSQLPSTYFLKANHGCGWNIICEYNQHYWFGHGIAIGSPPRTLAECPLSADYKLTQAETLYECNYWLRQRYSSDEWAYTMIPPKIIVEETLASSDHGELKDYRMYTFHGIVKAINVGSPRYRSEWQNVFFTPDWQAITLTKYIESLPDPLPSQPPRLTEMIDIAARLAHDLDFARIDLYDTTKGIMLGEVTLYPDGGRSPSPTGCPVFNQWLADQWL